MKRRGQIETRIGSSASGAGLRRELDHWRLRKLQETVDHVRCRSPFCRTLFGALRGDDIRSFADMARLPFTTADDIIEDDLRFLCVSRDEISRIAVECMPAVRSALGEGALAAVSVGIGGEIRVSNGSIKRKILDRREEI